MTLSDLSANCIEKDNKFLISKTHRVYWYSVSMWYNWTILQLARESLDSIQLLFPYFRRQAYKCESRFHRTQLNTTVTTDITKSSKWRCGSSHFCFSYAADFENIKQTFHSGENVHFFQSRRMHRFHSSALHRYGCEDSRAKHRPTGLNGKCCGQGWYRYHRAPNIELFRNRSACRNTS